MKEKKVVLITGGSRGIGLGIAKSLAARSYGLAINGMRGEKDVLPILNNLRALGVDVIYCQGNISLTEDRQRIIEKVKSSFGQLNVLINNAGIVPDERKDILEASEYSYERVMKTNLQGPYFLSQEIAKWMIQQKEADTKYEASIINISSVSATIASVNRGEYCLSKAGISMMTKLFAVRLAEYNIPVYEIRPGIIKTDMTAAVQEKYDKLFLEGITLEKRWGLPEDIGKAVTALVEGQIPYATGQVINVDGGLTIQTL
jgi:NAD(P)-dependent dehydrogenase (short-subunit alcohol dehydrogenase family)